MGGVNLVKIIMCVTRCGGGDYLQRAQRWAGSVVIHAVPVEQAAERYLADDLTGGLANSGAGFFIEPAPCLGVRGGYELDKYAGSGTNR